MHVTKGRPELFIASFVLMIGLGCSGTQPHELAQPVTIATTSPSASGSVAMPGPAEITRQETTRAASKSNRCAPDGAFPALAPEVKPATPLPCRPAEVMAEKTISTDMKARYRPQKDKSTVEVKFGCDELDRVISRIVLEAGGGHEGSLSIIEISRSDPNAVTYDVNGIRLTPSRIVRTKSPFEITHATLSQETVFAWMPLVRAALRATIEEIEPKRDPNSHTGGGSAFGSTANVHILVHLEDASARVMQRHFTGYESSFDQARYLPLVRAQEVLEQALGGSSWHADSPPDEVKHFFERTFVDAQKRFSDSDVWWIRERYVKLAAHAGSRALIPSLLAFLSPAEKDPSSTRTRDYAFEALVAMTGWDPRAPKNGEHPRTIEEAANDFIEECGKIPIAR